MIQSILYNISVISSLHSERVQDHVFPGVPMTKAYELKRYSTPLLSDAMERGQLKGGIGGLNSFGQPTLAAGRIVTILLGSASNRRSAVHLGARAIQSAKPGDILVIDNGADTDAACWGGLLTLAAKRKGVSGLLVNGLVRDLEEIREFGMPLLALGTTPLTARGRYAEIGTNIPVTICGVTIHSGDFAVLDQSGAVIIPRTRLRDVLSQAAKLKSFEEEFERALAAGEDPVSVLDSRYEALVGGPTG